MNPRKLGYLSSLLCAISLSADLPGERFLRDENGEGGDGGGGGGGNPPPKTFTQEDVDRMIAKRLSEEKRKYADYDDVKAKAAKVDEHEKKLAELQEQLEMAGKSEKEREKLLAEKLQAQQQQQLALVSKERDEAKTLAERTRTDLRQTRINYQLTSALTAAKALGTALGDAVEAFGKIATIETDDNDKITAIEVDGIPFKEPQLAAEAFLKIKPYYAAAVIGGGGTKSPNGAGLPADWRDMTPEEMAQFAWKTPAEQRR